MPRVQAYESTGSLAPLRPARVQPAGDAGAGAVAEGLERAGQAVQRGASQVADMVARERERATDIATLDATNGLQSFLTSTLEEAGDEQGQGAGFLRVRGRAAFAREAATLEAIEKKRKELAASLPTEDARIRYENRSRALVDAARGRMESHLAQERDTAAELTLRTTVEAAKGALAYGYADPATRAEQLEQVRTAVRARYTHAPPEELAKLQAAAEADLHADVIEAALGAGDVEGGVAYFRTHREALGKHAPVLEARVRKEEEALGAEKRAASIIDAARDPDVGWVDPARALAAVEALPEKQREPVRKLVEHLATKAEALRKQQGTALLNEAMAIYMQTGSLNTKRARDIETAMLEPKNGWVDAWRGFTRDIEQERRARAAEARARTSHAVGLGAAQREANRLARAEFRAMDPEERARVSVLEHEAFAGADLATKKDLIGDQHNLRQKLTSAEGVKEGTFYRALQEDVDADDRLRHNEKEAKEYKAFLGEWRRNFIETTKREPTLSEVEEARAEAQKMLVKKRSILPDTQQPRYKTGQPLEVRPAPARTPTSSVDLSLPAIPPDARKRILDRAATKYPGRVLSEEQIRAVYAAEQQGAR